MQKNHNTPVTNTPNYWVILKIDDFYKVFGAWVGSYTTEDSWKLNSGIKSVTQDKTYYYFYGFSGSYYKCHKRTYGIRSPWQRNILTTILNNPNVTLLEDTEDWAKIINNETNIL